MSRPLFSLNEEVIVQSLNYPEYNGEYLVSEIITSEEFSVRFPRFHNSGGYYYDVGIVYQGNPTGEVCNFAAESSLRKKHKPSEFGSYDQLMKNLKIGEKV